ncbi:PAS domain S-box protein [Brevundimonas sp. S30B]|uniref:PAS domain S-box protein n=1 Tax=unclassified Brevundimonas TaxID=2622653 RepID=UPI001071CF00|nr:MULTISPECIES: PAS domain S-box protein [unclassified Brevundimonas]QBX38097.1 PAS domain S-box protein [Brevundimonas sp. MF30-B]TFW02549.1 PAS domain S-box protein [Brevundimonas sp. S30B]
MENGREQGRSDADISSDWGCLASSDSGMAGLIRTYDWASTPAGAVETWPTALRTAASLILAAPIPMVLLWGEEGVMIYNDAYSALAGARHPGLLGSNVREGWPEVAAFNDHVMTVGLSGETLSLKDQEFTLFREGRAEQVWFDLNYWPVMGDDGRPAGVMATAVETTARVEADRQRAVAAEHLEMALSAGNGIGAWDWDVPADRITADERFARLYGVDPDRAQAGAPIVEFFGAIHPQDLDRVRAEIDEALRTGGIFISEYRLTQPGGDVRWVAAQGRAILSPEGQAERFSGVSFDVTGRRRMMEALRDSEERYRALFGESTTGLCIIEMKFEDGRPVDYMIVEGNAAFERLTGLGHVDGRWVSEVAPGLEQHWFDLYGGVALTGDPVRFENPADSFGRWYDVQAMRIGAPEARRVAILFNDITARKASELRHQVLLDLNDAIRDLTDPAEIAQASAALLAQALQVSRVGYGVMDTAAETITIERDYNAPGVDSLAGVIHFRDFGDYIEDLARGEVVVFDDAGADPRVKDGGVALDGISARALINLPLIEQGEVVALLFVNHANARRWTEDDVALVREVAERVRTATERARAGAALRRNAERLRFLDALNVEVSKLSGADEILAVTTRMTAEHLAVANCAYADMDADQDGFTIRGDWAEPGMASIVGHYRLADFGALAVKELGARRPLVINDNLTELAPEEAATFQAIGIGATICMPLVKAGRLTALMAVHHRGPHRWTADELETIREVTERSWAHVERARAEAELRESEGRFRNMADHAPMMMWVTDPSGACTYLNRTWHAFTGQTQGEPEGSGWLDAAHPEDKARAQETFRSARAARRPFAMEYRLRRADGVFRWVIDAASPRFDAAGEFLGHVGSVIDIDERREAEDALRATEAALRELNATLEARVEERTYDLQAAHESLRQIQKMEAVGQLTGGIAHDFNNLLAGISGSLELLSKRLSEGRLGGMERYIDAAQGATQRAAALTQRLLAFSRRQTLDPKPVDLNGLIAGMDDLVRRSIGPEIELLVEGAAGLWLTKADPSQLENALLNLCINARDAMAPGGGRLIIETSNLTPGRPDGRDRLEGDHVRLRVTDTGAGMAPDIQARVFDPFFTTKPLGQGTGLGLSMVHGFVHQSGGRIEVESAVGRGTTMSLYLPRYFGEADEDAEPVHPAPAHAGRGETVLVVDDEETVRMLVAEVLGEAGYQVIEAPDGAAGLDILRSRRRIDLLISDVGLPGGLNGRQVADAAREARPDLKVLFITGYAEEAAAVGDGRLAPGMAVMTKPFAMTELTQRVHDLVGA